MEFLQPPQGQQLAWQGREIDILDGIPLDDVDGHGLLDRWDRRFVCMVDMGEGPVAGSEEEQEKRWRCMGKSRGVELAEWER